MQTLMISLICFLAATLASVALLSLILEHRRTKMWMRAFGEVRGITPTSMEDRPQPREVVTPTVKHKTKAFSMPVPGADMLRDMYKAQR